LEDPGVNGRRMLERILEKYEGRLKGSWTDLITPRLNYVEAR
jgi:hypothetical protein